jgi:hypothetical protein
VNNGDCCILNGGTGAWAFEPLAVQLSTAIGVAISETPRRFNYVLCMDNLPSPFPARTFVPIDAIERAADKRLLTAAFQRAGVPAPETPRVPATMDRNSMTRPGDRSVVNPVDRI